MRIISAKGEFDLPTGFTLNITAFNQMFNSEGEQSVPVTLPPSPRNLATLRFPNRVDSFYKPISEISVDVIDDVFMRPARMVVHSANETDGISCTIYFSEASFYSLIDEKTMQDVNLDVIEGIGSTHAEKVQWLISYLKYEYLNQTSDVFSVFPVQTGQSITRIWEYTINSNIVEHSETFNLVLNGFETAYAWPFNNPTDKQVFLNKFMGEVAQHHIIDSASIPIDAGYGMTAFVNVFYFFQKMFDKFGYTFDDNQVRNHVNGAGGRLVMLNNVADAIYDAKLDLNQLVPAMTLKDFLKKMAVYLGGVWFVDEFSKKVEFHMYLDLFDDNLEADLTKYMSSPLTLGEAEFQKMDLNNTADTSVKQDANTTYIDVSLPNETGYVMNLHWLHDNSMIGQRSFNLKLLSVKNIIHMNSTLVVDGKVDTEKEKDSSKELILAGVRSGVLYSEEIRSTGSSNLLIEVIQYYKGYSAIYRNSENALTFLKSMLQPYFDWNLNSNISVNVNAHMTPAVLYSINLAKQYIFDGQVFFINKIEYTLPYDGRQKLSLKTLRAYADNL